MSRYDFLEKIARGRMKKFPEGNDVFRTLSRILEEAGELAKATNHYEKIGLKVERYGEGNKNEIAKESIDLIQNVIALLIQYDLMDEFYSELKRSFVQLQKDGMIEPKKSIS